MEGLSRARAARRRRDGLMLAVLFESSLIYWIHLCRSKSSLFRAFRAVSYVVSGNIKNAESCFRVFGEVEKAALLFSVYIIA